MTAGATINALRVAYRAVRVAFAAGAFALACTILLIVGVIVTNATTTEAWLLDNLFLAASLFFAIGLPIMA